ncbi:MAG TPA: sodium-translocating pyrophosphatase, partial [Candidatus Aenigmarchaeota archaeon]|nr:sodium-translocating pyrophosphatase [Candidatus Aenigmarchaeota archaeon]
MIEAFIVLCCILGFVFVGGLFFRLSKEEKGTEKMVELSSYIQLGAKTFLKEEYKSLSVLAIIIAIILSFLDLRLSVSFLIGAFFSALAGNIGMRMSTSSNTKTAYAAKKSLEKALKVAFSSGTIMGMSTVSLGLIGISLLYLIFRDPQVIYGFGFGASMVALFARVGGGIYTKAADIAADTAGKLERSLPEDDPRNPAVIADQVGDNVGDVAGMGSDLFESYVDAIIATMVIGAAMANAEFIVLPMLVSGLGILSSIVAYFFINVKRKRIESVLNTCVYVATILSAVLSYLAVKYLGVGMEVFYSILVGLVLGVIIGKSSEYYTSVSCKPAITLAEKSRGGAAINIIYGFATGMESCVIPVISIAAAIIVSYKLAGIYGIGLAAVGMFASLGTTLSIDSYGPTVDNAEGIAKMSGLGKVARRRCEELDAVGNTTAAIGKGFAIGSAALASLALFSSYIQVTHINMISLVTPKVIAALFIGALIPFIFSSITMRSVGKTASKIVDEVRRQFKDKNIIKGKKKPDYERCIKISSNAAIREMIVPGLLAIVSPLIVGFTLGAEALGGFLAGAIATGLLLAITLANSGGVWDNAKKYVEKGNLGG